VYRRVRWSSGLRARRCAARRRRPAQHQQSLSRASLGEAAGSRPAISSAQIGLNAKTCCAEEGLAVRKLV